MTLEELKAESDLALAEYRHAARRVSEEQKAARQAREALRVAAEARDAFQVVAEATQAVAHEQIEGVVSKAVAAIYPGYAFKIDFVRRRGKTEADLYFTKDGRREDPEDGLGQGVVDVAAFALRLVSLRLRRPRPRQLFVTDEPFRHVNGAAHRDRCVEMVEALARELRIQILIMTGAEWLRAGKVIELPAPPAGPGTPGRRSTLQSQRRPRPGRPSR